MVTHLIIAAKRTIIRKKANAVVKTRGTTM